MESDCETAAPVSREISCGVMVHTWGNLRAVLRNGQLWMVTLTPSGPSDCSTSVPARPIQATTLRSFSSNSSPSRSRSMAPACLAATRAKTSSSASGPPISWTSCRTIVASCPYRLGKTASARSVSAKRREGRPRPLRSGWLTTRPSRSRLVRCWRTAFGVTPRSLAMVSALDRPLRRSSSRTSIRVERPAIMRPTSGRFLGMLAQAKTAKAIYYRWFLTKERGALNLVSGGDRGNANDQAGQPRYRAHDRSGAPDPAGQVRPPEQDALHRQAPERARDAEPGRPAADAARAVGRDQQGHRGVAGGDGPGAGQAGFGDGGDGRSV